MNTTKLENPSAFPCVLQETLYHAPSLQEGMSLRDYFAAAALQGMLSNPEFVHRTYEEHALAAGLAADCALAERAKQ